MAVYIDDYRAKFRNMVMSHLMADTKEELLAFVDKIGVQRKWIQAEDTWREHFDVCESKRKLAIKEGAIEMTARGLTKLMLKTKKYATTNGPN